MCLFFNTCSQLQIIARVLKWACLTYCVHNCKTCLEQSAVHRAICHSSMISLPSESSSIFINFATLNFRSVLIFALTAHPRNLDPRIILLIQRLWSSAKILLREYFRKYDSMQSSGYERVINSDIVSILNKKTRNIYIESLRLFPDIWRIEWQVEKAFFGCYMMWGRKVGSISCAHS